MSIRRSWYQFVSLASLAALVAGAVAGCGGASGSSNLISHPAAGPTIYGVQPPVSQSSTLAGETSGFGATDYSVGFVTGAISSNAKPPVGVSRANNGTIPTGFWPGGAYIDGSFGAAALTGSQVVFAVDIGNGNDSGGNLIPINPTSVAVTNIPAGDPAQLPADSGLSFSYPMAFKFPVTGGNAPQGPFSDCTYTTTAFALPFTTTGLHGARAVVADKAGNSSYTDFYTLVLAAGSTDSAVVVEVIDSNKNPVAGATVSIDTPLAGVTAYNPPSAGSSTSVTDNQGVAIVFASAGAHTITASKGALTGTDTETLTADQVFDSVSGAPYSITIQ